MKSTLESAQAQQSLSAQEKKAVEQAYQEAVKMIDKPKMDPIELSKKVKEVELKFKPIQTKVAQAPKGE